jgi:hypothetical protein
VYFPDATADRIQKPAIVADDQDGNFRCPKIIQVGCQPVNGLNIEMVRWLIQDQQVMIGEQQLDEPDSATLATTQRVDLCVKIDISQQMINDRSSFAIRSPNMVRRAADDETAYGRVIRNLVDLIEESDRQLIGVCYPAGLRCDFPGQDLQQSGLAGSVATHNPNDLAAVEPEADSLEEGTSAVAHPDAFGVDQVAH